MGKIIGYILSVLFGGLFLLYGIACAGDAAVGYEGNFTLVTGKLTVAAPAADNALNLTGMGPVLFRSAEMYQYLKKSETVTHDDDTDYYDIVDEGFYGSPVEEFEAYESLSEAKKLLSKEKKYTNPPFPAEFLNENGGGSTVLCGTVEIGDHGIKLDESLLRLFAGEAYCLEDCTIPATNTPPDAGEAYGLKLVGDGVYASKRGGDYEIGDLQISYRVVDPQYLEEEFTAVGRITEDKVLYRDDDYGALYRGTVTMDQANHDYRVDQLKTGALFLLLGAAIVGVGVIIVKLIF